MSLRVRTRFPLLVVGILAVALGTAVLLIWYLNISTAARGGHDLSNFWIIAAWLVASGVGLLLGNRVAALALALPFALFWCWWLMAAAVDKQFISALAALLFAVVYLAPLALSILGWHLLGWSRWRPVV